MSGTLPFYGKGAATNPQVVAGYDYIPYIPEATGRSRTRLLRMTQSLVRHAQPKNLRDRAKRASLTVKKASHSLGRRLSTMFLLPCDVDVPPIPGALRPGMRQQRAHTSPAEDLTFDPQGSNLHDPQGIPHARREEWLLDHPERTTKLDTAVMMFDRPKTEKSHNKNNPHPPAPSTVPAANDVIAPKLAQAPTATAVTDVTSPIKPTVLPAPTTVRAPAQQQSEASEVAPVNPSQTFESILGHYPTTDGVSSLHRAIGLKPSGKGDISSASPASKPATSTEDGPGRQKPYTIKRKPVPDIVAYHPDPEINLQRVAAARALAATPVPNGSIETPSFGFISQQGAAAAEERERKQTNRQSWHRGEMHFDQKPAQPFHLPSGAVIGRRQEPGSSSQGLTIKEAKQLKRISYGFLDSGPDLSEAVEEIFEQALESPPNQDTPPRTTREFIIKRPREERKVSQAKPDNTASNFRHSEYPLLNFAAQTLNRAGSLFDGPLSQGNTNRGGSPPTFETPSVGEYAWPRFSDQDWEDPAVAVFRMHRDQRVKKRRHDHAAWNTHSTRRDNPEKVTPSQLSDRRPSDTLSELVNISSSEPPTQADKGRRSTSHPANKRHSAFLRSIDFTDSMTRSSPPKPQSPLLGDLIQF